MNTAKGRNDSCEICILAGGLSKRMGRDKSLLRLGGRSMLAQIRAEARRTWLPVRVIRRDLVPRCGPLGGVYTALKTTRAEAVVFLACDMPFVTWELLEWLVAEGRAKGRGYSGAGFAFNKGKAGFPFMLQLKHLRAVEMQIQRGAFSLQGLAKALKAKLVRLPPAWEPQLRNVNTPAEWERARKLWVVRASEPSKARAEGKSPRLAAIAK